MKLTFCSVATQPQQNTSASEDVRQARPAVSLTRQHNKFLDASVSIRLDPDKAEAAFIARQLVQATLPHRNPGNIPVWKRTNGNLTLGIQPGMNVKTRKSYGYPYGTIPRLLMFWMTTEALRTGERRLELGKNLASFMRQLDLDPSRGGKAQRRATPAGPDAKAVQGHHQL